MNRLTEIKTRTEDYQCFLESLDEISEILETSREFGLLLDEINDIFYIKHETMNFSCKEIFYDITRREDYEKIAFVLMSMWIRVNAKLGEIAFMLENDIEAMEEEETEILDDMEQQSMRDSDFCNLGNSCDDCYISECSSSSCQ